MVGRWWVFSFAEALDFPTFSDPPDFPQYLFSRFHYDEWQPSWSWFRRKVTSSLNVIFRAGFSFRPLRSAISYHVFSVTSFSNRHSHGTTFRSVLISSNPLIYAEFGTFRHLLLGCITRRKGKEKASCTGISNAQGLFWNYVFRPLEAQRFCHF